MTDFRSKAEEFVTAFLDYIQEYDIFDALNKQTNKMERSPGVQELVKHAQSVFPARVNDGRAETDKLSAEQVEMGMQAENVIDTREMFSRKVQKNGGTRALLRALYEGTPGSAEAVREFLLAEDGEKEFASE